MEEAVSSGIDDILIITGKGKRTIEDHFDRSFELELSLRNSGKIEALKEIEAISDMADIYYVRQKSKKAWEMPFQQPKIISTANHLQFFWEIP